MNIKYKITTAIATGTMMAALVVPSAFAANNVTIRGNGANSNNGVAIVKASKSKVKQTNIAVVGTRVTSIQNSGGNRANGNVGGGNTITTGNNRTTTTVTVAGGTNTNTGESCCCDGENGTTNITIRGNGANSNNGALIIDLCKHKVKQTNATVVVTNVTSVQNSGGNTSNENVGGENSIGTGNNVTETTITVEGPSNTNGETL